MGHLTRGVEKHLLEKLAAGNAEAFRAIVERKRKIVRRFTSYGIGAQDVDAWETDVFTRARGELARLDPEEEDLTVHLLDTLRDVAFQRLAEADYRKTLFATGRETFSSPPHVPAMPAAMLSGETAPDLGPWLDALDSRQQLLLELVFLEAAPIGQIAGVVNCSENILSAFLYHYFDAMAELSSLAHGDGCPPDLFLGMQVVKARGHKQKVKKLEEENSGCAGCKTLVERCAQLSNLFSKDWRPEPEGLDALLARIGAPGDRPAPAPGRPAARAAEFVAVQPAREQRASRGGGLVLLGVILVAFVWASVVFLDRRESAGPVPAEVAQQASRRVTERKLPEKLGTLSSASAAAEPLYEGSDVATDLRNPATLAYDSGARVELSPGGSGRSGAGAFTLVNGMARVEVPSGSKAPFSVVSGDAKATSQGGTVSVLRTPGRRTLFAVEHGSAQLTLPDGRTLSLDPGRQATIDLATGKSTIADYSPGDFSALAGSDSAAAPNSPAPFARPPQEGGGEGAPQRGGSAGGGVKPLEARGFRDSF